MRNLRLRRPEALNRAELYDAAQVYFSFPPVFYHCCYRRIVNMLAALQIIPMPSEATVLQLLSATGYNEHTNRTAPMNFAQWQHLVDSIKLQFMKHQAEDDEDFEALRAAVTSSSSGALRDHPQRHHLLGASDDDAEGDHITQPFRGDSLFPVASETVSPRHYHQNDDDVNDAASKSITSDSWFHEVQKRGEVTTSSTKPPVGIDSRPIPDICKGVSASLAKGAAQWLSLAADVALDEPATPPPDDDIPAAAGELLSASLDDHRHRMEAAATATAKSLQVFKGLMVTPAAASQLFLMDHHERKHLLEYFVLSLGAEDPDYRGELSYGDLLNGGHHAVNDHFLGDDWWQGLLLPECALEDCSLLEVPESCRPVPSHVMTVTIATTSALAPRGVVSFGGDIQLAGDDEIAETVVPSAYIAYLRKRVVRGGSDSTPLKSVDTDPSQWRIGTAERHHPQRQGFNGRGTSALHNTGTGGPRIAELSQPTQSPTYRSASAEAEQSYASLLFRDASQLAANADRAVNSAEHLPPAVAPSHYGGSVVPRARLDSVVAGDEFSPTIALDGGMSFVAPPNPEECPFGAAHEDSVGYRSSPPAGDASMPSAPALLQPTTLDGSGQQARHQRPTVGPAIVGQFYPLISPVSSSPQHGYSSPRSTVVSPVVSGHRAPPAAMMRVATPPVAATRVAVIPSLVDFDEFVQLVVLHRLLVAQHSQAGTRIPYLASDPSTTFSGSSVAQRSTSPNNPTFEHVVKTAQSVDAARGHFAGSKQHSSTFSAASPTNEVSLSRHPSGRGRFDRTAGSELTALSPRAAATTPTLRVGGSGGLMDGPDWGGGNTARNLAASQRHSGGGGLGVQGVYGGAHSVRRAPGGGNGMSSSMSSTTEAERLMERIDHIGPKSTVVISSGEPPVPTWMAHMEKWLSDHDHEEDLRRIVVQLRAHQERRERLIVPYASVSPRYATVTTSACQRDVESQQVVSSSAGGPLRIAQGPTASPSLSLPPFLTGSVHQHLSTKSIKLAAAPAPPARLPRVTKKPAVPVVRSSKKAQQQTIVEPSPSLSRSPNMESNDARQQHATGSAPLFPSAPPPAVPSTFPTSYPACLRVPRLSPSALSSALDSVHSRKKPSSSERVSGRHQTAIHPTSQLPTPLAAAPTQTPGSRSEHKTPTAPSSGVQHTPEFHRERMAAYRSVFQLS
jgi:hypothetical protein